MLSAVEASLPLANSLYGNEAVQMLRLRLCMTNGLWLTSLTIWFTTPSCYIYTPSQTEKARLKSMDSSRAFSYSIYLLAKSYFASIRLIA
ncbi:hypothetical protein HNQ93_002803 [Hymenobacter luteus]|uniref:Uncharacterized protein n=2 Tax=Hymenobacter TaxID=89966 RepID=A0A7W9T3A4_9BACT|nr:hypothetical protein [Hymenobacter latericoloratus]MBB6059943.1 hypothetical protein [Hymenobacter luteus]